MSFTPIPAGTEPWDDDVNDAFTNQDARITMNEEDLVVQQAEITTNTANINTLAATGASSASVLGFLAMPYAPEFAANQQVMISGTINMIRVELPVAATISTATFYAFTAGATLTAGQNLIGLYTPDGTRVAVSADQSASWNSIGEKNVAFTTPYAASAGTYYIGILSNGATPVSPLRAVSTTTNLSPMNHGLTAQTYRWALGGVGQTTMPASIDMSTRSVSGISYWIGLS